MHKDELEVDRLVIILLKQAHCDIMTKVDLREVAKRVLFHGLRFRNEACSQNIFE